MSRGTLREVLAEFLGTFVLILFGAGVVAQFIVSKQATAATSRSTSPGASASSWGATSRWACPART